MVRLVPIVKLEKEVFFGVIMLLFLIVRIEPSIAQLLLFPKNVPRYVSHSINSVFSLFFNILLQPQIVI